MKEFRGALATENRCVRLLLSGIGTRATEGTTFIKMKWLEIFDIKLERCIAHQMELVRTIMFHNLAQFSRFLIPVTGSSGPTRHPKMTLPPRERPGKAKSTAHHQFVQKSRQ